MPRTKDQVQQIRAESRNKILVTARRLFARHGFDGCNISDIAAQSGMSQGNVYWYFKSKEELFTTVLIEGFNALGSILADAAAGSGTGTQKLDAFLARFFVLMEEEGGDEFVTLVTTFIAHGGLQQFASFGLSTYQIGGGYLESLNTIFAQGQAEGEFNPQVDPGTLSTFFFAFVNGLILMNPDTWKNIPKPVFTAAIYRLVGNIKRDEDAA